MGHALDPGKQFYLVLDIICIFVRPVVDTRSPVTCNILLHDEDSSCLTDQSSQLQTLAECNFRFNLIAFTFHSYVP